MKKLIALLTWAAFTLTGPLLAFDQHVHVHGKATGTIIIDKNISIELTIPALSLVGFEHYPTSEKENKRIKKAIQTLQNPELFAFFEKTGWFQNDKKIPVTVIKNTVNVPTNNKNETHAKGLSNKKNHAQHLEFKVQLLFGRESKSQIDALSTNIMEQFPDLHELDLIIIVNEHQAHYKMSHKKSKINIKENK